MGIERSKEWETRRLPKENWEEISTDNNQPVPYGQFKVFRNKFTNEELEEYGVFLGSGEEKQKYLACFMSRLHKEYQVNTCFIDIQNSPQFCGCGLYAKVYTQRIPLRLEQLHELSQQEYIYVLHSALKGFEQLFSQYGYFRPTAKMVGVDKEGRIKVWINSDFSNHIKSCPLDLELKFYPTGKTAQSQDLIVWEILGLFREQGLTSKPLSLLDMSSGSLTFSGVRERLKINKLNNRTNIKYLQSVLSLINEKIQSSSVSESSHNDLEDISFHPQKKTNRVVYYINPCENSQMSISHDYSERDLIEKKSVPVSGEVNKQFSGHQTASINRKKTNLTAYSISKHQVIFNYREEEKIIYNGTHQQYQLDPDLTKDLHKLISKL